MKVPFKNKLHPLMRLLNHLCEKLQCGPTVRAARFSSETAKVILAVPSAFHSIGGEICGSSSSNLLQDHHLWIKTEKTVHLELHSGSDLSGFFFFFKVMMLHKETTKEAPPPNGFCLMLFHDSINVNPI